MKKEKLRVKFGEKVYYQEAKDNGFSAFGTVISVYEQEVISVTPFGTYVRHDLEDQSIESVIHQTIGVTK